MTVPHYAERVAKLLQAERISSEPPPAEARNSAIEVLQKALAKKTQARRRLRWIKVSVAGFGIAAAAVIALFGRRHFSETHSASSSAVQDITIRTADGQILERRSRVIAPAEGRALLNFSTGTHMAVDQGGELTILGRGREQRFLLTQGRVHADVAKLYAGDRFLIVTEDAEVEVRGTSFDVSIVDPANCGTHTRVVVSEGVVVVRNAGAESRVTAGRFWPDCQATAAPVTSPVVSSDVAKNSTVRVAPVAANAPSVSKKSVANSNAGSASLLTAQNDLFALGIASKRNGDGVAAVATFDQFLATYPTSALAESAAVERFRSLRSFDSAAASAACKKYLAAYPAGFARAEAEAIVAASP